MGSPISCAPRKHFQTSGSVQDPGEVSLAAPQDPQAQSISRLSHHHSCAGAAPAGAWGLDLELQLPVLGMSILPACEQLGAAGRDSLSPSPCGAAPGVTTRTPAAETWRCVGLACLPVTPACGHLAETQVEQG